MEVLKLEMEVVLKARKADGRRGKANGEQMNADLYTELLAVNVAVNAKVGENLLAAV